MQKISKMIFIVASTIIFSSLFFSCRDCSMETEDVHTVRLGFFKPSADGKSLVAIDTLFTKIYGLGNETVNLYPKPEDGTAGKKRNLYELPLDVTTDVTSYVLEQGTKRDTLKFTYTRTFRVYTPDCGYSTRISDFKMISKHTDILIKSTTLTSLNKYDVEIYK